MGYSGYVIFNGKTIFEEYKHNGTEFCLKYASEYLKTLEAKLSKIGIQEEIIALEDFMSGVLGRVESCTTLMSKLHQVISNHYAIDNDGKISLKIKVDDEEKKLIFEGHCPNVKPISLYEISNIFKTSVSGYGHNQEAYVSFVKLMEDATTLNDIINCINIVQKYYLKWSAIYANQMPKCNAVVQLLMSIQTEISNGNSASVKYEDNSLNFFVNGKPFGNCVCNDFYLFSNLFDGVGMGALYASCEFTTMDELHKFIKVFPSLKNRSFKMEDCIKKCFLTIKNLIDDGNNPKFNLIVTGSY